MLDEYPHQHAEETECNRTARGEKQTLTTPALSLRHVSLILFFVAGPCLVLILTHRRAGSTYLDVGVRRRRTPLLLTDDERKCLTTYSGVTSGKPDVERWTSCSMSAVKRIMPPFNKIMRRDHESQEIVRASDVASRHLTVVRFSANATSLAFLKEWSDFNFTIYDHMNGADQFASKFGNSSNGRVVEQINQCDEASGYLTRITDQYNNLADIEVFVHDDEFIANNLSHQSQFQRVIRSASPERLSYFPLMPTKFNLDKWGGPHLSMYVRTLYSRLIIGIDEPYDGPLETQCCGQFATTKSQIQTVPLQQWEFLFDISMTPTLANLNKTNRYPIKSCKDIHLADGCDWSLRNRAYCMFSHVYERLWGVLLGQEPVGKEHDELYAEAVPSTLQNPDFD